MAGDCPGRNLQLVSLVSYHAPYRVERNLTNTRLQEETAKVEEHLLDGSFTMGIIKCFTTAKANAFENLLEPLQKLLRLSPPIALSLAHPDLFFRILQKLQSNKAVVRLNLLRIIRSICDASDEQGALISRYGLEDAIQRLAESDGAVLVRNMAGELIKSSEMHDTIGMSGGRRKQSRRSSSSTTPPSLLTSYSTPPTPTSNRSLHSSNYIWERDPRQRSGMNGGLPYRPASRDGSGSSSGSGLPLGVSVSGGKSRLPRTTSSRPAPRQVVVSPKKEENVNPGYGEGEATSVTPAPNSRRRRRVSGDTR